jgi:hypothetical protein
LVNPLRAEDEEMVRLRSQLKQLRDRLPQPGQMPVVPSLYHERDDQ